MQTAKIPYNTSAKMEGLCKRFLWGDSEDKRVMHFVPWENVYQSKKSGGSGYPVNEQHEHNCLGKTLLTLTRKYKFAVEPRSYG